MGRAFECFYDGTLACRSTMTSLLSLNDRSPNCILAALRLENKEALKISRESGSRTVPSSYRNSLFHDVIRRERCGLQGTDACAAKNVLSETRSCTSGGTSSRDGHSTGKTKSLYMSSSLFVARSTSASSP